MKAETDLTLKQGQRVITTETKRTGVIHMVPDDVTKENNYPVLMYFDEGIDLWVRPSHLRNYSDN